ncbi:MAG: glycosyltransferase family 4 protein [Thermomicrobiales bacterium]|nr:glycosyltransferase family 4 protein [Thermomicrobiales bacterium]
MNQRGGIGRYGREVTRRLLADCAGEATPSLWYAPGSSGADEAAKSIADGRASLRRAPLSRRNVDRLAMRARLPIWPALNLGRADVAWSPDFTVPPVRGARRAITIHDLAWITAPGYASAGLRAFLDSVVPRQIGAADVFFVVSESTREAVLGHFSIGGQVVVAPNGVDERFLLAGSQPDRRSIRHLNLPGSYLLMVGTIEPRKNHLRVVEAMRRRRPDLPLVIAGGRGWDDGPAMQAMEQAAGDGLVHYAGYVDDALLPQLYANASGLIAASVEEGFDLPVLEGLAAGLPTLLSDIPVHREVAGDAASYCNPESVESIGDGIIGLVSRRDDAGQAEQRRAIASRYSWDATASTIWQTLKALA